MTIPRFEPANPEPGVPGARTEPVPPTAPSFIPAPTEPESPTSAVTAPPQRRSSGSARLVNYALGVALVIAAVGVAFALGRSMAPASTATVGTSQGLVNGGALPDASFDLNGGNGPAFQGGDIDRDGARGPAFAGGMTIEGTVDSITEDSITIRTADGNTITVGLDGDTAYHRQTDASASDVQAGSSVILRLTGGFRPDGGAGNGSDTVTLGTASDVTVVP